MIAKFLTALVERFCQLHVLGVSGRHYCLMRKERDGTTTVIDQGVIPANGVLSTPLRTVVIYEQP